MTSKNQWTRRVAERIMERIQPKVPAAGVAGGGVVTLLDPPTIYCSPDRDLVARSAPFPILPSALLRAGETTADRYRCDGVSLLLHRDASSSIVKAFRNQCRHRGSPLLPNSSVDNPASATKNNLLVCPYHAWTYDARTGALRGIPKERTCFPDVNDKASLGLQPVPCFEQAGLIWIGNKSDEYARSLDYCTIDKELAPLLSEGEGDIASEKAKADPTISLTAPPLFLGYKEWRLGSNWQLLVETFLEAYHVRSLHKNTLAKVAHSIMITDILDRYSLRMSVPLKSFDAEQFALLTKEGDDNDSFHDHVTTTYFLFPNTAISIFKRFILFLTLEPVPAAKGHSRQTIVRAWGVRRNTPLKYTTTATAATRDFDSVILGIEEDWACAENIARGIEASSSSSSDTNPFLYGTEEYNNVLFHKNVATWAKTLNMDGVDGKT